MQDVLTQRMVIIILGLVAIMGMILGGVLAFEGKAVPDFVIAGSSAAIGALGGVLVVQRTK